jgi:alpha-ribazole phosphatase
VDVYLIRHPRPDVAPGICYGSTDLDITPAALAEALQVAKQYVPPVEAWFVSPKLRARRLADELTAKSVVDARLCETDFGAWEMRSYDELGGTAEFRSWGDDFINVRPPAGESFAQLYERVVSFVADLTDPTDLTDQSGPIDPTRVPVSTDLSATRPASVAVVCHSGAIRCWIAYALGLPLSNSFRIDVGYGGVAHLWMDSDPHLNRLLGIAETASHTGER